MEIKRRLPVVIMLAVVVFTMAGSGCATKKYVRQTINERVTPLEGRTAELEETVRRNTQSIREVDDRLSRRIDDVSGRADRAQATAEDARNRADTANTLAVKADEHAARAEARVEDLRSNLDRYTLLTTVSVNFKLNSFNLSDESKAQLDTIALEAKNHQGYLLEIQGFTDSTGSTNVNDQLSQERAESVQRYLARQHQIPLYKMSILGLGKLTEETRSRAERAKNRRVDVRLLVNNAVNPSQQSTTPTPQQ